MPTPETPHKHSQVLVKFVLGCSGGLLFGIALGVMYIYIRPMCVKIQLLCECCSSDIYNEAPFELQNQIDSSSDSDSELEDGLGELREDVFLL